MTDSEVPNSVRRRRRPPKSCEQCRKRKLRCDRTLPCKPCKSSRSALRCTYDAATQRSQSPLASHSENSQATNGSLSIRPSIEQIQAQSEPDRASGLQSEEPRPAGTKASDPVPRPHLRVETEKTRLFGRSHWMHALEQFQVVDRLQSQTSTYVNLMQGEILHLTLETAKLRHSVNSQRVLKLHEPIPDLISTLPTKKTCDSLVENYLRLFEPVFRILHVPSFRSEYDKFWDDQNSATTVFLLKLVMLLTIGAIFHHERTESDRVHSLAKSWVYSTQWWLTGPSERSAMSLDGVQIFCLLILARQANSLGNATAISTESLMKLAFTLGLHLDPVSFPSLSVFQREMRRRLWLTVLELTIMTSLDSTLPLLISTENFNCGLPSNINDMEIQPKTAVTPEPHPSGEFTDSSIQLLLQGSLRCRLLAVKKLNNLQALPSYEETIQIGNELKLHCREIAGFFQSPSAHTGGDHKAADFHRKFLDSYIRRYSLFIYRSFALQARKDPRFLFARKACLECCQIIASHATGLNLPLEVVDEFSMLAIRGSGLFKGPLGQDIIVTFCLEIATQLEEERGVGLSEDFSCLSSDPLLQISRANRRPLIASLEHIHQQLRHIIALGRPSCKRYILLSAMIAQIRSMEAGDKNAKSKVIEAIKGSLQDCCELLQQYRAPVTESETGWTDDTSSDWINTCTLDLFGFDFEFSDPTMNLDIPNQVASQGSMSGAANTLTLSHA